MPHEATEVKPWLVKATHDWSVVKKIMATREPELAIAAFHCQQAVEKTLKAFLVYQQAKVEKIHDLSRLVDHCCQADQTFDALHDQVEPLTIYAVTFRYPTPGDVSIEQVREAMSVVETVWKFVVKRLPPGCAP